MKVLSKVAIGIVTVLSLCSCEKGTKTSRTKFYTRLGESHFEEKDSYKKARVNCIITYIKGYAPDLEKTKTKSTGYYLKDEDNNWITGSDTNGADADLMFFNSIRTLHLSVFDEADIKSSAFINPDDEPEEYYYIKPFGYELKHSSENYYSYIAAMLNSHYFYQWNDYGYVTLIDTTRENISNESGKEYTDSQIIKVKITYQ